MERRGEQDMRNNPMGYTPPQTIQESPPPVKLPLAPIISTLTDHKRPINSTRRGSSIFSPTQTLNNHPYIPPPHQLTPPPPPPPNNNNNNNNASPDPDPTYGAASEVVEITSSVRYKECLKNHAASMGGHVVDGCGEFMPGGDDGTLEALKCAACDCHRNFHRKEGDGEPTPHRLTAPPPHLKHHFAAPSTMVNFGGGGAAAESSSEGLNMFESGGGHTAGQASGSKKRFRTKFRRDQKDRMHEFAVKLGWRIQKQDEPEVQRFCGEVGVKRQVFKVWMHNNKQAIKKRDSSH
ncbi:hypothetical protein CASFOL_031027 [Castilleja foliolosa]|uniref:ZF-HD dimerization-type domain-containing protein n=1 Tax=Castilleja foliolosa TaxID=1961234 RepID=A0ABD3C6Z0_9LAMI